jgi:hypothetical protein
MTKLRLFIAASALALIGYANADNIGGAGQLTSAMITTALGFTPPSNALTSGNIYVGNGSNVATATAPGTGLTGGAGSLVSNAVEHVSFQPGLMTAVSNAKAAFYKYSKASTVDNIEGSAQQFSCTGNPTITMYECGTSTTCATPTTIGSVTVTAAGTVVDGTVSSAAITAGDYVAWAVSAGTCVTLDIGGTAQVHSN